MRVYCGLNSVPLITVPIFMPVCCCFHYYKLTLYLQSGCVIPLALFFLRITLAIQVLFWLLRHFWIIYSISVTKGIGILIAIALNT